MSPHLVQPEHAHKIHSCVAKKRKRQTSLSGKSANGLSYDNTYRLQEDVRKGEMPSISELMMRIYLQS